MLWLMCTARTADSKDLEMDPGMAQHTDVQNASQPNGQNATNAYIFCRSLVVEIQ